MTAMSSAESHLEGVESGADAYITKPFSPKLLLARAFKLIEQREKLREKFSNDPNMVRPAICTSDKDKEFADRLQMVMDQQIGNAQFTIDEFASMMGLGRTVFYRKVRGVTGYSPNEYIRIIRMKKAAELLLENRYTVAEVSYKVGINDPFYLVNVLSNNSVWHLLFIYVERKSPGYRKQKIRNDENKILNKKVNRE